MVTFCIPCQGIERVKPHWLVIEECRIELHGMIESQPCRLIGEQTERHGV